MKLKTVAPISLFGGLMSFFAGITKINMASIDITALSVICLSILLLSISAFFYGIIYCSHVVTKQITKDVPMKKVPKKGTAEFNAVMRIKYINGKFNDVNLTPSSTTQQ